MVNMRFRPCIDIHNGYVKQIVGGSLIDKGDKAVDNFVSEADAGFYAGLYKKHGLKGGHVIILNPPGSEYYDEDIKQARLALSGYEGGLQIGGGINADNARAFIELGADKVIVTSYVFKAGEVCFENLERLVKAVGKEHLVLDLSCRKKDNKYYIVTDRWQRFTNVAVDADTLDRLSDYCSEYLIHGVDVEGCAKGIETELVKILADWGKLPMTYAGGVGSFEDLRLLKTLGKDKLDVTIGSALDLFGGHMEFTKVLEYCEETRQDA